MSDRACTKRDRVSSNLVNLSNALRRPSPVWVLEHNKVVYLNSVTPNPHDVWLRVGDYDFFHSIPRSNFQSVLPRIPFSDQLQRTTRYWVTTAATSNYKLVAIDLVARFTVL